MYHLLSVHPTRLEAITAHDKTLTHWSLRDGTPTILTQRMIDDAGDICAIAAAPEGEYVAVATLAPITDRHGEIQYALYPFAPVYDFDEDEGDVFSPCVITLYNWHDLSVAETIVLSGSGASILSMCFSPDGRWIAAADGRGDVFLSDRRTSQIALTFRELGGKDLSGLMFDPTSTYLTVGDSDIGGGGVALYRLKDGELHEVIKDYFDTFVYHPADEDDGPITNLWLRETIFQVGFSPDGATLAIATNDNNEQSGYLSVYDTQRGGCVWSQVLPGETRRADGLAMPPVCIYDGHYYCSQLCFTLDGSQLISGDGNGDILCFDAADGRPLRRLPTGVTYPVARLALEPSGTAVWALVFFDHDLVVHTITPDGTVWSYQVYPNADKVAPAGDDLRLVRVALDK